MTAAPAAGRPDRTLLREMVRPRSLALLLLALVVAAGLAGLAQWQLSRAVQNGTIVARPTEHAVALRSIAVPQSQQTDASVGQLVTTAGRWVAPDFLVVADRLNRGERGWWVIGHAIVDEPAGAQLAVGLGWTASRAAAERAAAALRADPPAPGPLRGRYIDSDAASPSVSGPPDRLTSVSTAQLVNLWTDGAEGPVYEGVLTLSRAPAGLTTIYSPRPVEQVTLNLQNLVYAAEWTLFAGIAFYLWYRLVRDRWELEHRPAEDEEDLLDDPVPAGRTRPRA